MAYSSSYPLIGPHFSYLSMYPFFFILAFCANVALAAYLTANEKSHARPWRFVVAAVVTILLAYLFELGAGFINSGLPAAAVPDTTLAHLVKLTNLICGAFSGALASVAVTNRAMFMHEKKEEELQQKFDLNQAQITEIMASLKDLMKKAESSSGDPGGAALLRHQIIAANTLLGKLEEEHETFMKNMRQLRIRPRGRARV